MKIFAIKADAKFCAENIEDALLRLSDYFRAMATGDDLSEKSILEDGSIDIMPEET